MTTVRPGRDSLGGRLALIMEVYGLDGGAAARALGVSRVMVDHWTSGRFEMAPHHVESLDALHRRLRRRGRKGGGK